MSHKQRLRHRQQGSAIVIAIFIIVIISVLGAALASLQRDSAQSTSYEVYAARAYLSAYSAGEIALSTLFPLGETEVDEVNCSTVDTPATLDSDDAGFHGCSATFRCEILAPTTVNIDNLATRYQIVSTAVCENAQITTRREITIEAISL